jgi:hypothetical protein
MDNMNITFAQYIVSGLTGNNLINATIDGQEWSVPLDPANRHYAEILKQVAAGTLTIQDAD